MLATRTRRAVGFDAQVLLVDLDVGDVLEERREVEVLELMRTEARRRGMLVLIALHDLNQALRFADKALVIANGHMRACGASTEVITEKMLRDVYRVEARIEKCSHDYDHVIVDGTAA